MDIWVLFMLLSVPSLLMVFCWNHNVWPPSVISVDFLEQESQSNHKLEDSGFILTLNRNLFYH